ncbi:MAG: 3-phosphoserine/phosphohydroxythreonine transaminase [Gammaproteobacteria bacterium]|jgi:phosphoserine aminotransferase|nr:MAG: 3-phosphoserine/phosphohydroxythreonine transaminase [Gammaproteobacteria bacterium]
MTKKQVYNFAPGPAMLPRPVMKKAQEEFLDWNGTGMSVMEVSHRSKEFIALAQESEADLREILGIPANYKVLFLQGGASSQFAMVPMNLLQGGKSADYIVTGSWSSKAYKEAQRHGKVRVAATSKEQNYMTIPDRGAWQLDKDAAYVYICSNETIGGVEFQEVPDVGPAPLVADLTSHALSRPVDVSKFGLIIAGSQKNIGPAGLAIVIIRDDLIGKESERLPSLLDYAHMVANESMSNTPPTFSWYIAALVFKWIKAEGGLKVMEQRAIQRSGKLYAAIDASGFYKNPVDKPYRSRMNVPFTLPDEKLDAKFLSEAKAAGLEALKGHRSVGGMRASIYNAMPMEGVDALIDFMRDFEKRHG